MKLTAETWVTKTELTNGHAGHTVTVDSFSGVQVSYYEQGTKAPDLGTPVKVTVEIAE